MGPGKLVSLKRLFKICLITGLGSLSLNLFSRTDRLVVECSTEGWKSDSMEPSSFGMSLRVPESELTVGRPVLGLGENKLVNLKGFCADILCQSFFFLLWEYDLGLCPFLYYWGLCPLLVGILAFFLWGLCPLFLLTQQVGTFLLVLKVQAFGSPLFCNSIDGGVGWGSLQTWMKKTKISALLW